MNKKVVEKAEDPQGKLVIINCMKMMMMNHNLNKNLKK